ncbi:MAG: MFS transporter [Acidimicrobiia bacterium]
MVASDETEVTLQPPGRGETLVAPFLAARDRLTAKAEGSSRHRWWVLWTILGGLFAVNVAFTIIVVALPRIANELGTSRNTLTWVLTGPLLALGVVAPAMGKAGDLWGHRRLYLISILGVGSCALLSALAWNAGSLIAFRTLSAIEGAATGSSSLAIIFSVFHAEDRVKAMGWWSLVGAGGPVIGVAIGGPIIEAFGWRWVFAA